MSEEKQINELANDINQHCADLAEIYCGATHCVACLANALYNAGYRKQITAKWLYEYTGECLDGTDAPLNYKCTLCGGLATDGFSYCHDCGAKMIGEISGLSSASEILK